MLRECLPQAPGTPAVADRWYPVSAHSPWSKSLVADPWLKYAPAGQRSQWYAVDIVKGDFQKTTLGATQQASPPLPLTPYLGIQVVVTRTPASILDNEAALGQKPHAGMEQQEDRKNWGPDGTMELPDKPRLLVSGLLVHEREREKTHNLYELLLFLTHVTNSQMKFIFFTFTHTPNRLSPCSRSVLKMQRAELSPTLSY